MKHILLPVITLIIMSVEFVYGQKNTDPSFMMPICHINEDSTVQLISISMASLEAHMAHGDYLLYIYYIDNDGDGYGVAGNSKATCDETAPAGYADNTDDCDDSNASINPKAEEICFNGMDDDCDGEVDEDCYFECGDCANKGTYQDYRDGQEYATVTIGDQCWMAENLNYAVGNSWCYKNDAVNCETYGRLYDWQTATTACPFGWHLPTEEEWTILVDSLGGKSVAGGKMKSTGTLQAGTGLWNDPNTDANNESCFTGLAGGYRDYHNMGNFDDLGNYGNWWSATELDTKNAWRRPLLYNSANVPRYMAHKKFGFSVRCVRD